MSKIIEILNDNHVELTKGLSDSELKQLETLYSIVFPPELKELYKTALPISKGFYNWRDALSKENFNKFKAILEIPFEGIKRNIDEIDWVDKWGKEPENEADRNKIIIGKLALAPKLVPIFGHRYMRSTSESNFPVLSIAGWDIIYYGNDLENYFKIEFKLIKWEDMDFSAIKEIDFWSDIM